LNPVLPLTTTFLCNRETSPKSEKPLRLQLCMHSRVFSSINLCSILKNAFKLIFKSFGLNCSNPASRMPRGLLDNYFSASGVKCVILHLCWWICMLITFAYFFVHAILFTLNCYDICYHRICRLLPIIIIILVWVDMLVYMHNF